MKSQFTKIFGRLSKGSLACCTLLSLASGVVNSSGADSTRVITGIISSAAQVGQIDATNVVNKGYWDIETTDPFTMSDMLTFSNLVATPGAGVMIGAPGWVFDCEPSNAGVSHWSSIFFNDNYSLIQAIDVQTLPLGDEPESSYLEPSKIFVSATNIINHGGLTVGANGWLQLNGSHVDLSRGLLEVSNVYSSEVYGSFNNSPADGYFLPDVGVSDVFWAQTNLNFDTAILWDGTTAETPVFNVQAPGGGVGNFQFGMTAPYADSYIAAQGILPVVITNGVDTNSGNPITLTINLLSNVVKQAVFVGPATSIGMSVKDGFSPSPIVSIPPDLFQTIGVLMSVPITNAINESVDTASIYVRDTLASETNFGLLKNVLTVVPYATYRPANYLVSRINQGLGSAGNNGYPEADFFLDSGDVNTNIVSDAVTNSVILGAPYAAYSADFDDLVSEPSASPNGTVTNLPGRVRIYADDLDLTKTRIRGQGQVIISTPYLVSSTNTVIDCQNLSFDLAVPGVAGSLNMTNLASGSVARMTGNIYVWSALWTNQAVIVLTNFAITNIVNTNTTPNTTNYALVYSPLTNITTIGYHTLMVDASEISAAVPVNVYDLLLRSTNVVISDNANVVESFFTDAQSLTLNGTLAFSSATIQNAFGAASTVSLNDWVYTNAPNVKWFTNNGTLTIPNNAHFGDDGPTPYTDFINAGTISAASLQLDSAYFENSGTLSASASMTISGGAGKLQNGTTTAGGVAIFQCENLKFNNYQITANGRAYFQVTNSLYDAGAGSSNLFQFEDGFNLLIKPPLGDLLGTTFKSVVPNLVSPSVEVDHYWAGEDRGATAAGYLNNEAIGQLVLSATSPDPLFVFAGTGAANGLYVDLLDISALGTNYQSWISINPNLTIYYAAAKLGFTPPKTNGVTVEPEEYLDGQFGGHLKWVQCYAGPNSSVDVIIGTTNGLQSIAVNKALRNSMLIDSDGDHVWNGVDAYPFNSNAWAVGSTPLPPVTLPCGSSTPAAKTFVSITSPSQGQSLLQSSADVQGTAGTTNGTLAYVYYQVNNSGWIPASSGNGGANWSGSVSLSPGNNTVQAYAQDSKGNQSAVASVNVTLTPSAALSVVINGSGTVVSNYNGQLLALNQTYTMTAYPGAGYVFASWGGSVNSTNPVLTFLMKSNLTIVANFVQQSFTPSAASYSGLFYETGGVRFLKSGLFSATTTTKGAYSGNLQMGGKTYSFNGKFNSQGYSSATNKNASVVIAMQMNTVDNSTITGTVSNANWLAQLFAVRGASNAFTGSYTLVMPGSGDANDATEPFGEGYGTATVKSGSVKSSITLADGQSQITPSASVSGNGQWPLYASLYSGNGQILGWLTFSNSPQQDLSGWVSWIKQPVAGAKFYPAGFDLESDSVTGSLYNSKTNPVTGFTNAVILFQGGNISGVLSNKVSVTFNNKVSNLGGNDSKLTLNLNVASGVFTGALTPSNSVNALKFGGVILQKQGVGAGNISGTNQTGKVSFGQ